MQPRISKTRKTVLCIDDDPGILTALRRVLRRTPYEVVTTPHAWQGLKLAHELRPELILLDIKMPGLDGRQLMQGLRQTLGDVPVVFITGCVGHDDAFKAYELGAAHYVRKPFDNQEVLDVVEFLLGDISDERRDELMGRLCGAAGECYGGNERDDARCSASGAGADHRHRSG